MNNGIDDLTPEERALAQRLARLRPHVEPASELDARILAAAHDAMAQRRPMVSRRPRWPVALGIAASLVLAVGIAWRMRPLPGPIPSYHEGASQAQAVQMVGAPAAMDEAAPADASATSTAAPMSDGGNVSDRVADAPRKSTPPVEVPMPRSEARQMAPSPTFVPPPSDAPAIAADSAADAGEMAAAPAPRAFEPAADAPTAKASATRDAATSAAERANAAEIAVPETRTLDRLQAGASQQPVADEPGSEVPPATMASPQARDAWLARIRELIAAGHAAAARDSLQEFTRRYPDYPLPADVRALGP